MGSKGGRLSKRKLSPLESNQMLAVREANRAFKLYKSTCFWSFPDNFKVTQSNLYLVTKALKEQGNLKAFNKARQIEQYLNKSGIITINKD